MTMYFKSMIFTIAFVVYGNCSIYMLTCCVKVQSIVETCSCKFQSSRSIPIILIHSKHETGVFLNDNSIQTVYKLQRVIK